MRVEVTWNGPTASDITNASRNGLLQAAEHIGRLSDAKVPFRDGALQDSGTVTVSDTEAAISYNTPYAVKQHEDLSLTHTNGREGKYLEKAFREGRAEAEEIIAGAVKAAL